MNLNINNSNMTRDWLIYRLTQDVARCRWIENNPLCNEWEKQRFKAEWDEYEKILKSLIA